MNLGRTSIALIVIRFCKIAFSVITLTLLAKYFGVAVELDLWIITSTLITTLNLALWGPLNETFRAKFVHLKETEGEAAALFRVRSLLVAIFLITVTVSILLVLFSENISQIATHNIGEKERKYFINIFLLLIPSLVINEFINIGSSVLNAYNIFYLPEILGISSSIINLIVIYFLGSQLGVFALIIGLYISILVNGSAILLYVRKNDIKVLSGGYTLKFWAIKPFIYFSLPFFFPYFITQIQTILEKFLANDLGDGIVSIVNYSGQFKNIIQAVLTSVLASIMVPALSSRLSKNDKNGFVFIFTQNIHIVFVFLSFVIPFLIGAAEPIIKLLFGNSKIEPQSIDSIIFLSRLYILSLISVMLYLIFGLTLLAQQKNKAYAIQGLIAQLMVIGINILFYKRVGPTIFPISIIISHFIVSVFMWRKLNIEHEQTEIFYGLGKYILFILGMSFLLYEAFRIIKPLSDDLLIQSISIFSILIITFLISSPIMGFKFLLDLIKRETNNNYRSG